MTATAPSLSHADPSRAELLGRGARWRDYLALTRPRVLALVLLTAPPALLIGQESRPGPWVVIGVLFGAALVGAGCSALNAWYERDLDGKMARTRNRPLPDRRIAVRSARDFGLVTSAMGLGALFSVGGWLPAAVGVATLAHYLGIYTAWLKPRSPHSTVVGGAAGAATPLIADAAVDGRIGPWGLVLFAIVFLWQPPHVWAIALYRGEEYAAAGVPLMPAVIGERATRRRMLAWALLLIPVSLLPSIPGPLGPGYALAALAGGAVFVGSILRAIRLGTRVADRAVFRASILYLAVLLAVMLGEIVFLSSGLP